MNEKRNNFKARARFAHSKLMVTKACRGAAQRYIHMSKKKLTERQSADWRLVIWEELGEATDFLFSFWLFPLLAFASGLRAAPKREWLDIRRALEKTAPCAWNKKRAVREKKHWFGGDWLKML